MPATVLRFPDRRQPAPAPQEPRRPRLHPLDWLVIMPVLTLAGIITLAWVPCILVLDTFLPEDPR